ncbi:AraC-type DNA-binding protein [Gracilibacillus ureilyticus]|uniref:AraC-type DNA-binding protein n=1 Tax=Gracilibacillus ureilyticus TaxID=531814 RepID=A0A1H9P471_9BACI|nr:helix-turn-helix domain-containing protein [Gracilibacillus ureilyticus]SER43000.1 AraC-type DNA-binding protein [Gracilibacillus ureilyticus]
MNEHLRVGYRTSEFGEFDYHSHPDHYEIYFFHSGSCRYLIHNQIFDLEPGDLLLMDGMTLHKPNVNPNKEYIRSVIHFSPQWIKNVLNEIDCMHLLEVFEKLRHCLIRTRESDESKYLEEVIHRLYKRKIKANNQEDVTEAELKILLMQVLLSVYHLGQIDSIKLPQQKSDKLEHSEKIAEYIQNMYMYKLSLNGIAKALNLSKSYVSHVFKEMTGFTVMEYVMGCRLTQVKYLLEMEPEKALKDIAYECGFESVSHFSRYFREKVGVTAKQYRQIRLNNK